MKIFYTIIILVFASLFVVGLWIASADCSIIQGYHQNARTPLFSGFITLGSFLLTLKTTILQRLKEGFDSKEHEQAFLYHIENGGKKRYYESLGNMSSALSLTVFLSLGSSAIQMTFGFVNQPWAFALCVAAPCTTLASILFLWREITLAHRGWINKIEEDRAEQMGKRK